MYITCVVFPKTGDIVVVVELSLFVAHSEVEMSSIVGGSVVGLS